MVRTSPFHGGNRGSNPLGVTKPRQYLSRFFYLIIREGGNKGSPKGTPLEESPWGHQSFGRNIEAFLFFKFKYTFNNGFFIIESRINLYLIIRD